jgi:hypothetical protein
LEEILAVPFALPSEMPNDVRCKAIVDKCATLLRTLKRELLKPKNLLKRASLVQQTKRKLDKLVYDYYGVCEWERHLIADTEKVFRFSSTPGSLDSNKLLTTQASSTVDRETYAATLVSTFRGWTRTGRVLWTKSCIAPKAGLAVVSFGVGGRAKTYREVEAESQVEELLDRIRKSCANTVGTIRYLRGFAFFEESVVHLLKPLGRRYWTRTAALNDADEILSHMMEEGGWGD